MTISRNQPYPVFLDMETHMGRLELSFEHRLLLLLFTSYILSKSNTEREDEEREQ